MVADETTSILESWAEFWDYYADRSPYAECLRFSSRTGVSFGLPHPLFNNVYPSTAPLTTEEAIHIRDSMNARSLPWFWAGAPSTQEDHEAKALAEAGLTVAFTLPGMILSLADAQIDMPLPEGLEIREAQNSEELEHFISAILPAYEMPPQFGAYFTDVHEAHGFFPQFAARYFYGIYEGKPVCGSILFCGREVAILQCVGTTPETRGRGFGSAVVYACLRSAQEQGYPAMVLQASDMGYPLYKRMGFKECFSQHYYMHLT